MVEKTEKERGGGRKRDGHRDGNGDRMRQRERR